MTMQPGLTDSQANRIITAREVAEVAGVGPSAVSNWRRRHADFPALVSGPTGDGYRLGDVIEWLDRHNKKVHLQTGPSIDLEAVFWLTSDELRGVGTLGNHLELFLQLVALKRTTATTGGPTWSDVVASDPEERFETFTEAMAALANSRPQLRRAMQPSRLLDEVPPARLAAIVTMIDEIDHSPEILGELVSEVIYHVGETLKAAGEFQTPLSIAKLLVQLVGPITGTVYDPACGAGMALAEAWRHRQSDEVHLLGQELAAANQNLAALHLELHEASYTIGAGNTLVDDRFADRAADHIVVDAPLGLRIELPSHLHGDDRFRFGIPGSTGSDAYWIQQAHSHLSADGRAATVTAPGFAFTAGSVREIRRRLIESGVVEAVIQLPSSVLPGTQIAPLILLLRRETERSQGVLVVDASGLGEAEWGGLHNLSNEDISRIVATVHTWRSGDTPDEAGFATVVPIEALQEAEWSLVPGRHLSYYRHETTIDGEPMVDAYVRRVEEYRRLVSDFTETNRELEKLLESITPRQPIEVPRQRLAELLLVEPIRGMRPEPSDGHNSIPHIQTSRVSAARRTLTDPGHEGTIPPKNRNRTTKRGDVLLTTRGLDRERPGCAIVGFDEPAAFSNSLLGLRPNPELLDAHYLRAFLMSRNGRRMLSGISSGSAIANLTADALASLEIPVPDIKTQHQLADVMTRLEDAVHLITDLTEPAQGLSAAASEGLLAHLLEVTAEDS